MSDLWNRVHSLGERPGSHHGESLRGQGLLVLFAEFLAPAHLGRGIWIRELFDFLFVLESGSALDLVFKLGIVVAGFQHVLKE